MAYKRGVAYKSEYGISTSHIVSTHVDKKHDECSDEKGEAEPDVVGHRESHSRIRLRKLGGFQVEWQR